MPISFLIYIVIIAFVRIENEQTKAGCRLSYDIQEGGFFELNNVFDPSVFAWLNGMAGHLPLLDAVMAFMAQYALEIYILFFIIAWFVYPKGDGRKRHVLVIASLSGIFALLINAVIAHIWLRPRPFAVLPPGQYTQLIPHAADASFPSDHGSGSAAFAAATWGKNMKWTSRWFTGFAVLVMIARVYAGLHWPTDMLGSLVVGSVSSKVMWKLSRNFRPLTKLGLRLFGFGPYAGKNNKILRSLRKKEQE